MCLAPWSEGEEGSRRALLEGRESESDPDSYEYIDPSRDIFLENINPGVSKQGEAIFTVAPDAHGFVLRAGDTQVFEDKNCYFELGF